MLKNGDFSQAGGHHTLHIWGADGVTQIQKPEIVVPAGWDAAWCVVVAPAPHDPNNRVGYVPPETRLASFTEPNRFGADPPGFLCFTFFKIHSAGLLQTIDGVQPGARLRLKAQAHAWSNHQDMARPGEFRHPDDPKWSEGAGYDPVSIAQGDTTDDKLRNFTFRVGIDPAGGTNPMAESVVWGQGRHIYNAFDCVEVMTQATGKAVTVFLHSHCMWPFKHNDAYWDDVTLEVEQVPSGTPNLTPYGSKVGIHTLSPDDVERVAGELSDAPLCILKAVDDLSILSTAQARLKLARKTSGDEGAIWCHDPAVDYGAASDALFKHVDAAISQYHMDVDYWELTNEPGGGGVGSEYYTRLANLMMVCMDKAERRGIKLALFSFAAGTPEWDDMVAMVATGVFQKAYDGGHVVAVHEGVFEGDPVNKWWGSRLPGAPGVPDDAGALCGRFLYLIDAIRRAGQDVPAFVVTEFVDGSGYSDATEIMERLMWYDRLLARHHEVAGFTPFTWGPVGGWVKQDYGLVSDALVVYNRSIKDRWNSADVVPPPPPPQDGAPRIPYIKEWHLLSGNLGLEQQLAVARKYWSQGEMVTVGFSFDDAMTHYGLEECDVWLHGFPVEQHPGIIAFKDQYYPQAYLSFVDAPPAEPTPVSLGIHDENGAKFMVAFDAPGWCTVIALSIRKQAAALDYSYLKRDGVESTVVVRLGWGFAHPHGGTCPPPAERDAHLQAIVGTILQSKGVDVWQVGGNEVNNPREWPGGGPEHGGTALTPDWVVEFYNDVYDRVHSRAKLALPTIDPYFGAHDNDPADWYLRLMHDTHGADMIILHGCKTQTNALDDVFSDVKFSDEPLTWQYFNAKSFFPLMEMIPERYRHLPVMLGEVNPMRRGYSISGTKLGWDPGNAALVDKFIDLVQDWNDNHGQKVTHMVFYRWEADDWAIRQDREILNRILDRA